MLKYKDIETREIKAYIDIKDFIKHHKKRIKILKDLLKKYRDRRLVTSIAILGLESLAKFRYPEDKYRNKSKIRFIKLLSKSVNKKEAEKIYNFYRCAYVHVGFPDPFIDLDLESEGTEDENPAMAGISEKDIDIPTFGHDYIPPETFISIYEELIHYIEYYFKKKGTNYRILKFDVCNVPKEEKRSLKEMERRAKKFKDNPPVYKPQK